MTPNPGSEAVDTLEAEVEATLNQESQLIAEEQSTEVSTETLDEAVDAPVYKDIPSVKLVELLEDRDKKAVESDKRYKNLQALSDRNYNKMRDDMLKVQAQQELLVKQSALQGAIDPGVDQERQERFDADWSKKIAENPAEAMNYYRGMAGELQEGYRQQIADLRSEFSGQLHNLDPDYRENRELVDRLTATYNVDPAVARKMAKEFGQKKVSQPGAVQAPGRTVDGSVAAPAKLPARPMQVSERELEVLRMSGLSEEEQKEVLAEAGEELAALAGGQ